MSSVAAAQTHIHALGELLAPNRGWKDQVNAIHRRLTDEEFPHRLACLKWSRVKAWFYAEARGVDWTEMRALEELRSHEEFQREQREYSAFTNKLAAALAREGASFTRDQLAAIARIQSRQADGRGADNARSGIARRFVVVSGGDAAR